MKVLVTGVNGQLGRDVMFELHRRGHYAVGSGSSTNYTGLLRMPYSYTQMFVTDYSSVYAIFDKFRPDTVIHCAAWTSVDAAEEPENLEKVLSLNVGGTENIARACKEYDCKLVYISTDYVFNGQGTEPWQPDNKEYQPLNVYGLSKLRGEMAVSERLNKYFVVRTAWVFGANGKNFVKTMLDCSINHDSLPVVDDQIGTPTYTHDLARLLVDMIETDKYGYYHATNEGGFISWADFASEIFKQAGKSTIVIPVSTREYGSNRAARPFNSRLDKSKLLINGFIPLPTWQDALSRFLFELEVEHGTN